MLRQFNRSRVQYGLQEFRHFGSSKPRHELDVFDLFSIRHCNMLIEPFCSQETWKKCVRAGSERLRRSSKRFRPCRGKPHCVTECYSNEKRERCNHHHQGDVPNSANISVGLCMQNGRSKNEVKALTSGQNPCANQQ